MTQPPKQHPRSRRLQVVLKLTEREEQAALHQWGELQQRLQQEEQQREQLQTYSNEYQQRISAPGDTAISAGHIHNALGFMGQIETALISQNQQIKLLHGRADSAKNTYLALHGKVKALTELIDKLELEAQQSADKNAQKQTDEWATRNAFKSRRQ